MRDVSGNLKKYVPVPNFRENLTRKELARFLEISQTHISEMEDGKCPIGKEMANRLAKVLHVGYKVFL